MSRINGFVGRRNFIKLAGVGSLGLAGVLSSCMLVKGKEEIAIAEDSHTPNPLPVTPLQALRRLLDGNQRFIRRKRQYPDQSVERMRLIAKRQYPFAAILGCADSRVPAEIVFDQGLGDLFVVRVAGNVAADMTIGSLEYSTTVLGVQLIVVLGHRRCGAVNEAINNKPLPGKMDLVIAGIRPAVERVKLTSRNIAEDAVLANIQYQTEKLHDNSPMLAKLVEEGKLKIVGALYDLETGKVSVIT